MNLWLCFYKLLWYKKISIREFKKFRTLNDLRIVTFIIKWRTFDIIFLINIYDRTSRHMWIYETSHFDWFMNCDFYHKIMNLWHCFNKTFMTERINICDFLSFSLSLSQEKKKIKNVLFVIKWRTYDIVSIKDKWQNK